MPLSVTPAAQAMRAFATNPATRWYKQGAIANEPNGLLAFQRLRQSPFTPHIIPQFRVARDDKVFAIGSCFARGVEAALIRQGMQVLSKTAEFDSFPRVRNENPGGFVNKYNVFSIYNELYWALDPAAEFPCQSIVPVGNNLYYDPHACASLQFASLEETLQRRAILRSVTARVQQCRVIIITLGLVEVWRDTIADVIINATPLPEAVEHHPERYEFHVSSFAETIEELEKIHGLLEQHGHPGTQIVVTVSPVPLMATFSGEDVVVANSYSKSMLRAAAQEWASHHTNVHYFPSYEIVQCSQGAQTWEEDLRHVRGQVVQHIMRIFLEKYLD